MEIQKIFSEVETGEVLYSVLMDEDEMVLYSAIFEDERMYAQDVFDSMTGKKIGSAGDNWDMKKYYEELEAADQKALKGLKGEAKKNYRGQAMDRNAIAERRSIVDAKGRSFDGSAEVVKRKKLTDKEIKAAIGEDVHKKWMDAQEAVKKSGGTLLTDSQKRAMELRKRNASLTKKLNRYKTAGKVAGITGAAALTAGAAYGAKKLYDAKKKNK